jgi:hypothetical protein
MTLAFRPQTRRERILWKAYRRTYRMDDNSPHLDKWAWSRFNNLRPTEDEHRLCILFAAQPRLYPAGAVPANYVPPPVSSRIDHVTG